MGRDDRHKSKRKHKHKSHKKKHKKHKKSSRRHSSRRSRSRSRSPRSRSPSRSSSSRSRSRSPRRTSPSSKRKDSTSSPSAQHNSSSSSSSSSLKRPHSASQGADMASTKRVKTAADDGTTTTATAGATAAPSEEEKKKAEEVAKRRERMRLWRLKKKQKEEQAAKAAAMAAVQGGAQQADSKDKATGSATATDTSASKPAAGDTTSKGVKGFSFSALKGKKGPRKPMLLMGKKKKKSKTLSIFGNDEAEKKDETDKSANTAADVDPLDAFMANLQTEMPAAKPQSMEIDSGVSKKKKKKKRRQGTRYFGDEEQLDEKDWEKAPEELTWLQKQEKGSKKELKKVDHSKIDYPQVRKNFYIEASAISKMTKEEVKKFREQVMEGVKIRGKNCPKPIKKWSQCGLTRKVMAVINKEGYTAPFPIQMQAIPAVMSGRDVIGCAKTGSGKTLAFVLPMLRHIMDQPPLQQDDGPVGLILAPTRELAVQIYNEVKKFARPLGLRSVAVYGGAAVADQINALRAGAEIIVATPGRMIDVLCANGGRVTNLRRCSYVVLDEADRMFDLGFAPQIMMIIDNIRPDRQTLMFSATFPKSVEMLARKALTKPIEIIIGGRSVASGTVSQFVEVRPDEDKFNRLLEILGKWYQKGNILVFVDRQEAVDKLFQELTKSGYPALALHGGMDQTDRDYTIMDFKAKLRTIMVATSIVARGLDIKDLVLVINYTVPNHYEDYVHRVGRTGRAGRTGTAITFITPDEERYAPDLVKALEQSKQIIPDDLVAMAEDHKIKVAAGLSKYSSDSGYGGKGFKFDDEEANAKKAARQALKAAYSDDAAANVAEAEEKEKKDKEKKEKEKEKNEAKEMQSAMKAAKKMKEDPLQAQLAAAKRAAAAAAMAMSKAKGNEITDEHTQAAKAAVDKVMRVQQQANAKRSAEAAKRLALMLSKRQGLVAKPGGDPNGPQFFTDEIEINDYPQHARWKITHRSTTDQVQETTECAITTKGMYVPPGRKPQAGERKLYLLIEGKSENAVAGAKHELRRILEEAALNSRPEKDRYAKYSLLC